MVIVSHPLMCVCVCVLAFAVVVVTDAVGRASYHLAGANYYLQAVGKHAIATFLFRAPQVQGLGLL